MAGPFPHTSAGQRLVTTHNDLHASNIVNTPEGLRLIDMEACAVSSASACVRARVCVCILCACTCVCVCACVCVCLRPCGQSRLDDLLSWELEVEARVRACTRASVCVCV